MFDTSIRLFVLPVLLVVSASSSSLADLVSFGGAPFSSAATNLTSSGTPAFAVGNNTSTFSNNGNQFDVLDATGSTAGGPDGVHDLTLNFRVINGPNVYSGGNNLNTTRSAANSSGHHLTQIGGTGFRGRNNHGNNNASDSVSGDLVGVQVEVLFTNPNLVWEAQDLTSIAMTSINTAGEVFESSAVEFLDANGTAFGSATYAGFWSTPPIGATGGSTTPSINSNPWTVTGNGVFTAMDTGTVNISNLANPTAGSNGANNDPTISATSTGLAGSEILGGFRWTVYLEDIASLDSNGDGSADLAETTSSTSFTATLNSMEFSGVLVVPEPGTFLTFAIAVSGIGFYRRRRNREIRPGHPHS